MANNDGQSDLERLGIDARETNIVKNEYQEDDSKQYNDRHTKALSDDKTPRNGRGTGVYLDTYNGGTIDDIEGTPSIPGSGRKKNLAINKFDKENPYKNPNTGRNRGQVRI